jgi:hypothetical protein
MPVENSDSTDWKSDIKEEGQDQTGSEKVVDKARFKGKGPVRLYMEDLDNEPNELLVNVNGFFYGGMEFHKIPQGWGKSSKTALTWFILLTLSS